MVMADPDVEEEETRLEKLKKCERRRDFRKSLSDPPPAVCSLFPIRDYPLHKDFAVFPPVNHENLYISTNSVNQTHSQSSSPPFPSSPSLSSLSSSSFSPSHRDNDDSSYSFAASDSNVVDPPKSVPDSPRPPARAPCYRGRWWNLGLQVLFSRFAGIAMLRCSFNLAQKAVMLILSPFGMAAMLVMFAYFRRRRRLIRGNSGEELRRIIRAKDERINQLLSQIAEMNQLDVFDVTFCDGIVQQPSGSFNCGLFMCAYAEFLSNQSPIPQDILDVDLHRTRYGALLWDYGVKKLNNGYVSDNDDPKYPREPCDIGVGDDLVDLTSP